MRGVALVAVSIALSALPCASLLAATHDFDADGQADIVWRDAATGENAIWRSGNRATRLTMQAMADPRWRIAGSGDFDGNGRADLLWRHATNGGNVIWLNGNANSLRAVLRVTDPSWRVAGIGDFDADGRSDILWRHLLDGRVSLWPSASSALSRPLPTIKLAWTIAGIGDLDGDGRDDIVWRHRQSGANAAWRSADPASVLAITGVNNMEWKIAAVDDFDGDGRADLLWRHPADARNVIWHAARHDAMQVLPHVYYSWYVAGTGDYDDDGRGDVHWRDAGSGRNVVWPGADATLGRELAAATGTWTVVPYEGEPVQPLITVQLPIVMEANVDTLASAWLTLTHESVQPIDWSVGYDNGWGPGAPYFSVLGEDLDYAGPTTGRIPAGGLRVDIPLRIEGDTTPEGNEGIYSLYPTATNAHPMWEGAIGWILNDDANTLLIGGSSVWEGNAGTRPATFNVWLSRPQATPVTFTLETFSGAGGATPNVDYIPRSVTNAVIPAGATHYAFDVQVMGDTVPELSTESVYVRMTAVEGVDAVLTDLAFAYIFEDDGG